MSKNKPRHASTEAGSNVQTMGQTQQPTQEKTMEATQHTETGLTEAATEMPPEVSGPTAKEMAAAEEQNQARILQQAAAAAAEPAPTPVPIADVAARGYDALHEQFRRHNEAQAKKKEYVPPPRTQNQMDRLQEELQAGAKAVARAKAQQEAARPVPPDGTKEGFTTPVYRPNDVVPDPVTGKLGAFGPDA